MRTIIFALGFALAAFAPAAPAFADERPVYTAPFSNVGIGGYDVVAYFTAGRAVRGAAQFKTTHQNVEYRFASAAPARYLPQYGGYCAWAISQNYTASGNPNNWRIVDGKLYLNYNDEIQRRWEGDIPGFITSANTNWPGVLGR